MLLFPPYTRCKTFEFFGKFKKQKLKLERESIKRKKANGQPEVEQMELQQSIGSERPDGRIDEKTSKPFRFFWQNEYQVQADEPDSTSDHYNIQCRWDQKIIRNFIWFNNFSDLWKASELEGDAVDGGEETMVKRYFTVNTKKLKNKRAERFELKLLPTILKQKYFV